MKCNKYCGEDKERESLGCEYEMVADEELLQRVVDLGRRDIGARPLQDLRPRTQPSDHEEFMARCAIVKIHLLSIITL